MSTVRGWLSLRAAAPRVQSADGMMDIEVLTVLEQEGMYTDYLILL